MAHVKELAYVVYEVSDLEAWKRFGVDLLGMMADDETEEGFNLRTDERSFRWQLEKGTADDLVASGYLVESREALDELRGALTAAGHEVTEGDADLRAKRQADAVYLVSDPMGNRVELVTGHRNSDIPWKSDHLLSTFVTGQGGSGHQVLMAHGVTREVYLDFYVGLLGFKISDTIVQEVAPGVTADLVFLHCNPRHHTAAFGDMPNPKRTHHFMVEVADIRDVGLAWDRCLKAKQPIEMTLGMHPNDHMFSFYVFTPSGFSVEYGWGGLLIDDDTWEIKSYDQLHWWGHQPGRVVSEQLAASPALPGRGGPGEGH